MTIVIRSLLIFALVLAGLAPAAAQTQTRFRSILGAPFNVMDYGAEGDVRTETDGTTTDGSSTLSSVGYIFKTAEDVGKHIEIKGAATTGSTITGAAAAPVDSAFQEDNSAGTFVDETADLNSAATGDVLPFPASEAIGDNFYVAHKEPISGLTIDIGTSGVGGTVTWEYWDGTAWTALTGVTDGTTGFTAAPGSNDVTWTVPGDWATRELKTGVHTTKLYYVRANLTGVYSTNPVLDQGFLKGGRIRITSTAHSHGHDHVVTNKDIAGTTEANGTFTIDKIDANTFDLISSDFANAYTSGGTAHGYLITTISSVSGGNATLAANAGATISGTAEFRFGTEDGAAINLALAAVDDPVQNPGLTRKVVYFPDRQFFVGENLIPPDNDVVIRGAGMGATKIIHRVDDVGAIFYSQANPVAGSITIEDMTIAGRWFINQTQGADNRPIHVFQRSHVKVQNVEVRYSRFMSITGAGKYGAEILDNRVMFSARDAINVTGSEGNIRVSGNVITHCWDDAVAVHVTASNGNPPNEGIVITDNEIYDSFGIKTLGGTNVVVANNVGRRLKGYFFQNGNSAVEGLNDPVNVLIANNVASDVLNANNWGGGNVHDVIRLDAPVPGTGGGITAVPPGQFDTTANAWVLPEDYRNHSNLPDADWPKSGGWNFNITGNNFTQTLRDVNRWSDWGYGEPESLNRTFTSTGWLDFAITGHVQGNGDAIALFASPGFQNVRISDNLIKGFLNGINAAEAWTGRRVGIWIKNNQFIRLRKGGIALNPSTPNSENVQAWIRGNYFDLDPYVLHANRNGNDGTWLAGNDEPYGANIVNLKGAVIESNTFRNLNNPMRTDADSEYVFRDNWHIGDFTGSTTTNKGIRDLTDVAANKFIFEDSDPTSANYSEIITMPVQTSAEVATNSPVSAGSYAIGHVILAQTPTTTFRGWVRLTWGSAHVLNTDWVAF